MSDVISCPQCSKMIRADERGRIPPWCRYCGSDLRASRPTAPASAAPAAQSAQPELPGFEPAQQPSTVRSAPAYFQACAPSTSSGDHRIYRFYPTASEVLAFEVGCGHVGDEGVTPRSKKRRMPVIGLAAAFAMRAETNRMRLGARALELDAANEAALRALAVAGDHSFMIGSGDLLEARIEPPSSWVRWFHAVPHSGTLRLNLRVQGKMVLALPSWKDVRVAADELTRLFGEVVQADLPRRSSSLASRQA
jgi:hypothetical protein